MFGTNIPSDTREKMTVCVVGGVVLVYLITAYNSVGFHNADEHFQIIEFANYKLGVAQRDELAWEFDARLRSGIQPALCYLIFKFLHLVGVQNVYVLACALRGITGVFAILVIYRFFKASLRTVTFRNYTAYLLLSYFLWFLPFINVRFSSETWSGLFFIAGLTIVQRSNFNNARECALLALLLGCSVLFRYQMAISVLGLIAWLLLIGKIDIKNLVVFSVSGLLVMTGGFFIDRWFYGEYSFTAYNYFHANIIEEIASQYGVSPWYEIVYYLVGAPGPLGILIFLSLIILLVKRPKNVILWVSLPFLLVHSIIPHKEVRFLFPLANLVPLLLITAYTQVVDILQVVKYKQLYLLVLLLLVFSNSLGLWVVATKGAGNAKISAAKYIFDNYRGNRINVIHLQGKSPYSDWPVPRNTFYSNKDVKLTEIVTIWQVDILDKKKPGYTNVVVLSNEEITGPRTLKRLETLGLKKVHTTISSINRQILKLYKPDMINDNLLVYDFVE